VAAYPQRLFDRAVVESVRQWKFPPGADRRSYEVDVEFKR
jgi:outer membrane biosynthesis protein TonB